MTKNGLVLVGDASITKEYVMTLTQLNQVNKYDMYKSKAIQDKGFLMSIIRVLDIVTYCSYCGRILPSFSQIYLH